MKGLKSLSNRVISIIKEKKVTNYNDISKVILGRDESNPNIYKSKVNYNN